MLAASPLDQIGTANNSGPSSLAVSTTGATVGAGELAVTVFTVNVGSTPTFTAGGGWTHVINDTNASTAADYIVTGAAGTITETETFGVAGIHALGIIATFKAAAVAPTVSGVAPTFGPPAGGTSVVITGTGFSGTCASNTVKFGLTSAATPTGCSATSLTAVSPAGAAATIDVTVTVAGSTSATVAADHFTYGTLTLSVGGVPGPVRVQRQGAVSGGNVTALAVTLPALPAINNLLVVVGGGSVAAIDTLVAPAGYTLAGSSGSRAGASGSIWYKVALGGESATVTLRGTSGSLAVEIQEWSGLAAVLPLDKTANNVATAAGFSAGTGATLATTQASEVVIAGMVVGGVAAGHVFSPWSAGYTTGPIDLEATGSTKATGLGVASQVVAATGIQSATATWTTSGTPVGVIATFKASGAIKIVAFPTMTLNGNDQTVTQTVDFTVADTTARNNGWTISGTGTQFSDGNGHTLPATATKVTSQPGWACGTGCSAPNLPPNCVTLVYTLATSVTSMCRAGVNTGQNTMTGTVTFTLAVPGSQVGVGTYRSTWTFTIA